MICCPIIASDKESVLKEMREASAKADIIEIRLDYISGLNLDDIKGMLSERACPIIMTCRKEPEGGKFNGGEEERTGILRKCIEAGADYVDIELSSGNEIISDIIKNKGNVKVIVSYHNFEKMPENMDEIYSEIKATGCDIAKIVCMANSLNDNNMMLDLLEKARGENFNLIGFCMGEKGQISRVLCTAYGSYLTFGSMAEGRESAPGQINCRILRDVYRANELKEEGLKIYGLLGNPVSESKGFLVHNLAFKEKGLNAVYLNFPVDNLDDFFKGFKQRISGLSITMPYKQEIMKHLDGIDEQAKRAGAVNTVMLKDGKLVGYNTDVNGAIDAIAEKSEIKGKNVVILGAGGVARAVGYGVMKKGGNLVIVNRTAEKGRKLAAELGCEFKMKDEVEWDKKDIVVNATSVGMSPNIEEAPLDNELNKNMIVFDTVYNPADTKLLMMAREKGCTVISGIKMFVNQAARQFELWTGEMLNKELMEKNVLENLK